MSDCETGSSEFLEDEFQISFPFEEDKIMADKNIKKAKTDKGHFTCHKCGSNFTLASNYQRHMRHNKICGYSKGFKCPHCHKVFSLNATMKDHYERCIAEDPYRFSCTYCPKQFTFKSSLNKHLRGRCKQKKKIEEKGKKLFQCKHCVTAFPSKEACLIHMNEGLCQTSSEPKTTHHTCLHCGNRFTLKSSLTKHLRGRCKMLKANDYEIEEADEIRAEVMYDMEDVVIEGEGDIKVLEQFFDENDVIEECSEEWDEFIAEDAGSYVKPIDSTQSSESHFVFIKEDSTSDL